MNIYLIGMMGSGKSTVGKILAEKMELLFRDISRNLNSKVLILEFIKNFASPEKRYV